MGVARVRDDYPRTSSRTSLLLIEDRFVRRQRSEDYVKVLEHELIAAQHCLGSLNWSHVCRGPKDIAMV